MTGASGNSQEKPTVAKAKRNRGGRRKRSKAKKSVLNNPAGAPTQQAVVSEADMKKIVVSVANPKFKEKNEPKFVAASLKAQGVSGKAAKELAEGAVYEGAPMASITVKDIPQNIVINCQIAALHLIARDPQLLFQPADSLSNVSCAPSEIVAYLVFACLAHLRKLGLLTGANAAAYTNAFNEEWHVPVGIAKFLEYYCRIEGPPAMQTSVELEEDFTLSEQEVSAPTGTLNYQLNQLQIFTQPNGSTARAVMFPCRLDTTTYDYVIFTGPYDVPYTGLATGSNSFISSKFPEAFSRLLHQTKQIETVKFSVIPQWAPDFSAWAQPYGTTVQNTNWTQYTGILCPNRKFDPDMVMTLRPNFNFANSQFLPFPLGHQSTVPQGSATNYTSALTQFVANGINVVQSMDWFYWNCTRSQFAAGQWRKHMRMFNGLRIPRYFNVVLREIDTYGLESALLMALAKFANSNVAAMLLTDDYIDAFLQFCDALIVGKTFLVGNCFLQSAVGANTLLSIQQLIPNLSTLSRDVPLFVKAVVDQIGPVFADGTLYLPQITVNAYGTLANPTVSPSIFWNNWPKFGTVRNNTIADIGRYQKAVTSSVSFPFVSMTLPVQNATGANPATGSANVPAGAGNVGTTPSGQLVITSPVRVTALAAYQAASTLAPVGSFNANYVFWQSVNTGLCDFVDSLWNMQQINMRGMTAKINGLESLGGPSMMAISVKIVRDAIVQQNAGFTHYSVTQAAVVPGDACLVYQPYTLAKINYFVPLSPVDMGLAIAFPVSTLYKDNTVPYVLTTAYATIDVNLYSNATTNDALEELLAIDGPVVKSFTMEAMKNHTGKRSLLRSRKEEERSLAKRDCLRKGLLSLGERISSNMAEVDWVKVTAGACDTVAGVAGVGWLRPACKLIPKIYKQYKSVRDAYDAKLDPKRDVTSPLLTAASH